MSQVLSETPEVYAQASKVLSGGGLVVLPTRTNYALICDCENGAAVERVFQAKRRTKFGPLTLAVPTIEATDAYVHLPAGFGLPQLRQVWPAEISFIFTLKYHFPPRMTMGAGTVAVMFQRESALMRLLAVHQQPVGLTSANLSGQGNILVTREHALNDLSDAVDLIIVNDAAHEVIDPAREGVNPSNTIVDLTFDPPCLVRDGAFPPSRLSGLLPDLVLDTEIYKEKLRERLESQRASA
jgi:L-threonylcarbamoyladenylate synthase